MHVKLIKQFFNYLFFFNLPSTEKKEDVLLRHLQIDLKKEHIVSPNL